MLPGQLGLLIIGIASVIALALLGLFSYLAFAKEKRQKEKEARAKRRAEWHESMKATADDDLLGDLDAAQEPAASVAPEAETTVTEEVNAEDTLAEDDFPEGFDPFAVPEKKTAEPVSELKNEAPAPKAPAPKPSEKRATTRNDFDFKF